MCWPLRWARRSGVGRRRTGTLSATSVPSPGSLRIVAVPPCRSTRPTIEPRTPMPVLGDRRRGRSRRPGRGRTPRRCCAVGLGVHVDPVDPGVLGRVDHRLAGRLASAATSASSGSVADRDDLDRHLVGVLDLGGRSAQRGDERVAGLLVVAVQPGPQLALLPAGQRRDRRPGRRRSSAAAPGSAAPSRAGGRRRRRAPATGPARGAPRVRSPSSSAIHGPRISADARATRSPAPSARSTAAPQPPFLGQEVDRGDGDQHRTGGDPGGERPAAGLAHPPAPRRVVELAPDDGEPHDADQQRPEAARR